VRHQRAGENVRQDCEVGLDLPLDTARGKEERDDEGDTHFGSSLDLLAESCPRLRLDLRRGVVAASEDPHAPEAATFPQRRGVDLHVPQPEAVLALIVWPVRDEDDARPCRVGTDSEGALQQDLADERGASMAPTNAISARLRIRSRCLMRVVLASESCRPST
jgi:hypothetical protein